MMRSLTSSYYSGSEYAAIDMAKFAFYVTVQRFEKNRWRIVGRWGSLSEGPNTNFRSSSNAPWALYIVPVQAEKATAAAQALFWGCAGKNIKAKLPFHGMRQDFGAF
jgi:hypothetical protein